MFLLETYSVIDNDPKLKSSFERYGLRTYVGNHACAIDKQDVVCSELLVSGVYDSILNHTTAPKNDEMPIQQAT
jgi:hypothetical protein